MKNIRNVIIMIFLIILPIFVYAETYTDEIRNAQNYLNKSNFEKTYTRYIINKEEAPYDLKAIPFVYVGGSLSSSEKYNKAGFISTDEYKLTIEKRLHGTEKMVSYLNEGMSFWTLTETEDEVYIINKYGKMITSPKSNTTNLARATEYVKSDIVVSGIGTFRQPWTFDPVYKVTLKTESKKATIDEETNNVYVRGYCTEEDCQAVVKYTTTDGYRYITDDCNGVNNTDRQTITVSNIDRDTVCNVTFGIGRFKLTLHKSNSDGRYPATNVEDKVIYLKFDKGFFNDYSFQSQIKKIEELPQRSGKTFKGYTDSKGVRIVDSSGNINQNLKDKIIKDTDYYVEWESNKYNIEYQLGDSSAVLGNLSPTYASYDEILEIDNPTRTGYTFTGWTISGVSTSTAKYGTTEEVSNKFTSNTQTLGSNVKYYYNLTSTNNAKVTFTANWSAISYTVTYSGNGSTSGTMSSSQIAYDSDFITRQNAYSKTGYSFKGWNEKADGTGTSWSLTSDGVYESGKTKRWTYTYNITLYAVWQKNTFTCKKAYDSCGDGYVGQGTCYYYKSYSTHTYASSGVCYNSCSGYCDVTTCYYCSGGYTSSGCGGGCCYYFPFNSCSSGWTKTNGACYKYNQTSCPAGSEVVTGS